MRKDFFGNKECPFKVPGNYFEEFEERLLSKVEAEEAAGENENTIAPVISIVKPWLAMAAGFLLIALIYYQAPRIFSDRLDEVAVESMSEEDLINSIALIVDENEINELIISQDSAYLFPADSLLIGSFTEEELAALTYFD
ncbi:hypothetical protein [Marinilabilia sp.]